MKLYVLNGYINNRGCPRDSAEVRAGHTVVRARLETTKETIQGVVSRVWKKVLVVDGKKIRLDHSVASIVIVGCEMKMQCYSVWVDDPVFGHVWHNEILREPTFGVAYGCVRTCEICGKREWQDYTAGRIGGPVTTINPKPRAGG